MAKILMSSTNNQAKKNSSNFAPKKAFLCNVAEVITEKSVNSLLNLTDSHTYEAYWQRPGSYSSCPDIGWSQT